MANIFDTPTKQTYVDTYVPLPFQAIAAVGDKIQKQNADTESAMSALENEIAKLNVVGQVETRPGEFKSTGYKEHKDNLLNNTHVKIKQIVDDHLSGKIDANQFQSSFGNLQKEILGDYEKLKFASANSKTIDEQAKLVRTNPKVAEDSSVLNLHYKENQRLLDNPFSNEYMGAAIGTVVDEVEAVNKFVRDNKDQVLSYVNQNKGGYHTQGYITGVSGERLRNEVHALFNEHEIGRQYRRRLDRAFDDGAYGTDEKGNPITFDTPTIITKKDKDGKIISSEKSTFGRDRMRENEEKFTQAVILKGVSETPHLSTNVDVFAQEKRAADRKAQEERASMTPWNITTTDVASKDNISVMNNILAKKPGGSAFEMDRSGKLVDKSEISGKRNDNVNAFFSIDPVNNPYGQTGFAAGIGIKILQATRDNLLGIKNKQTEIYTGEQSKAVKEVIEFLKNSNQYDEKKPANAQYQNGLKLYEAAIKSGVLNSMAVPEFPQKIAKDFGDAYIPKGKYNDAGNLISTSGGRAGIFSIPGIDQDKVIEFMTDATVIGPDVIQGPDYMKFQTKNGKSFSAKINSPTLQAAFNGLSDFNIKTNEAIFSPSLEGSKTALTNFDSMVKEIGKSQKNNPAALNIYNKDYDVISQYVVKLKEAGFTPIVSFKDANTHIYSISFINRQDPNNPEVKVLNYLPGLNNGVTVTNMATLNADIYQQNIGNFAANIDEKSSENKIISTTVNKQPR